MSNTALIFATVKTGLAEISKQAAALAEGLQNAAPGEKKSTPNNSIEYLFYISKTINKYIDKSETFPTHSNDKKLEL